MKYKKIIIIAIIVTVIATPVVSFASMTYDINTFDSIMQFILSSTVRDVTEEQLIKGALKGMFQAVDPYSEYFTKEELKEFNEETSGQYSGVGIIISESDGYIVVTSVMNGGPADKAGIKKGDRIVSVDGTNVAGMKRDKVSDLLKGDEGTTVRVGIMREGSNGVTLVDIIRGQIRLNPIIYSVKNGVGYIKIFQFTEYTEENLEPALDYMRKNGIKSIVLDLRGNPGGIIPETIDVAQHFVPKGPIVKIIYKNAPPDVYYSNLEKPEFNLAVLIDKDTASAAEILAGAIQDTGAGIVIGSQSYGKGSVQIVMPLEDGSGFKLTMAKYATPKDRIIDGVGIIPDVKLSNSEPVVPDLSNLAPLREGEAVSRGSINLQVFALQQRLKLLGYDVGELDGVFGQATERALKEFQTRNGLKATGTLDEYTYINLVDAMDRLAHPEVRDIVLETAIQMLKNKEDKGMIQSQ
ncbi:S41 family peptidase [Calorimonas adulescens]|uniref:S41 family peptidase n=1 Tax=Calorimonas adulescens TaxID=2606906 RepID=A0A5D8QEP9_9THEO|nr:S41 family peptidase [Calorimonas adulescens]TZE82887.1 S41 family peptidase [Calorimonas adulescens]